MSICTKAQERAGETDDAEKCAAATRSSANAEAGSKADLLESITNQEDMDEAVKKYLFDTKLEDLAVGQPSDVSIADIVFKAPLSSNYWYCFV